MRLKVHQPELNPRTAQVWLDGHEITHGLLELTVHFAAGDVTNAVLRITVDDLDVDANTLAVLEAHVKAQEEQP